MSIGLEQGGEQVSKASILRNSVPHYLDNGETGVGLRLP